MKQKVIKIGNSLGIILPYEIRKEMGLKLGDSVAVQGNETKFTIRPMKPQKKPASTVDAKFMQMVDEFINDHEDVLKELANK